uniref:Uncharacterized protein n=1 Tax=Arundo donax TaxID=35708 RepID=A0A0A9AQ06_ARUDO
MIQVYPLFVLWMMKMILVTVLTIRYLDVQLGLQMFLQVMVLIIILNSEKTLEDCNVD